MLYMEMQKFEASHSQKEEFNPKLIRRNLTAYSLTLTVFFRSWAGASSLS